MPDATDANLRVAVLSRSFSRHPVLRAELSAAYPNATFNDTGRTLVGDELIGFMAGHNAAIVALERIDDALFAAVPEIRILSKYGVGLDNVDLVAAHARGLKVGWSAGVNRRSVAELAIGFMINGLHGASVSAAEVRARVWRQFPGRQLSDAVVGLVGFGHVGQEVARLLRAFGAEVLAHDIRDMSAPAAAIGATLVDLDTLVARSDVISLHIPMTPATRNLFDAKRLAAMKLGGILINTARGGIVDEDALAEQLRIGHLAFAGLDVYETEPPDPDKVLALPNVMGTAHIGGSAEGAVLAMGRAAITGLSSAIDPRDHIPVWLKS